MHFRTVRVRATLPAAGVAACLILSMSLGCGGRDPLPPEDPNMPTIKLRSSAFTEGDMIPEKFTCDGADHSPPLAWSSVPDSARSLVLICDDPDAPRGTWSHWVAFNLPVQIKALKEAVPSEEMIPKTAMEGSPPAGENLEARQGKNDFGKTGYGGPCPPSGTHRYFFRLFALNSKLQLDSSATRADVLKAIQGRIVAEGKLMGKYQRAAKG
jgi:Raf kinase inhibitor-like YbhB/YbcL family protein